MPITPFLNGQKFDAETRRVLGVAFEVVCVALRIGDCDDDVKQCIASQIIELASDGERNPDVLSERALKLIRGGEKLRPMSALPPIVTKLVRRNEMTRSAKSGCEQSQQSSPYSITSSASASRTER
jgi:hypothetical protein